MSRLLAAEAGDDEDVEMTSVQQTVRKVTSGINATCQSVQIGRITS